MQKVDPNKYFYLSKIRDIEFKAFELKQLYKKSSFLKFRI